MKRWNIPWKLVDWTNSLFLIGTLAVTLFVVPVYLWFYGLDWFQAGLFVAFFIATGLSITLGYHRLFSHRSFKTVWPVKLATLVFGAAAFENSALSWAADHRRHHKFVDDDEDPYDISKGFFHAHIGWILLKLEPVTSLDFVKDLQRDTLVMWQHRQYRWIAILAGLVLPAALGGWWQGWQGALTGFLVAGIARVVLVQHFTFFINSLCHTVGRQTYSGQCSARDSGIMALFTFGEGYHNFHHTFQHDYRNGVKAWQFDPTKWSIWLLHKLGLAHQLRRVPEERILLAEVAQQQRNLARRLELAPRERISHTLASRLHAAQAALQEAFKHWEQREAAYLRALEQKIEASRERLAELHREFVESQQRFRAAIEHWRDTHRWALAECALAI